MPDEAAAAQASLRGCRVLVARPQAQSAELITRLVAAGAEARALPLLEIAAVADPSAARAALRAGLAARRWIFSSTNAVQHAAALLPPPWPPVAAVGPATAAALQRLGCADVLQPVAGDGAAALLAHPALQALRGDSFLLVSGEQPLAELALRLPERGAVVDSVAVYRRVPVVHAPEAVSAALAWATAAIVPSGEALDQLVRLTPAGAQAALLELQLALPSARVVEIARRHGFRRAPLLPQRVSDSDYVEALRQSQNPGGQDRPRHRHD